MLLKMLLNDNHLFGHKAKFKSVAMRIENNWSIPEKKKLKVSVKLLM